VTNGRAFPVGANLRIVNGVFLRALVGLAVVAPLVVWSALRLRERPSAGTRLQAVGALGLLTVIAAHLCEALHLFPGMGWGRPGTVGHYLDLTGATLGVALLPVGYLLSRARHG
jgi:hypothetical protein